MRCPAGHAERGDPAATRKRPDPPVQFGQTGADRRKIARDRHAPRTRCLRCRQMR